MRRVSLVIPVRYASTRFPGKALFTIEGKPLIRQVVERSTGSNADELILATDSPQVQSAVKDLCPTAITKKEHASGTDRVAEVARSLRSDYILILQGDQLITGPEMINSVLANIPDGLTAATLIADVHPEEVSDENVVKAIVNKNGNIIYMSRFPIPYRKLQVEYRSYRQTGIYVFSKEALLEFSSMKPSSLETSEGIELLRVLDYGHTLYGIHNSLPVQDVDVPDDIGGAKAFIHSYPVRSL